MPKIDLHIHSTHSDGTLSPKQLINHAIKKRIPAISITDHNKATANKEAKIYAKKKGIEYVSGIEITITPPRGVKELHIVGLFIDSENKEIKMIPKKNKKYSIKTTKAIIKKINKLGYKITFSELSKKAKAKHFSRPFIAKVLMKKYPKKFKERKQVFDELLGKQGKAFVKSKGTELKKAIKIIHNAGGIAIVSHPWYLGENMLKILNKFVLLGGDGIELDYTLKEIIPKNTKNILKNFVKKHDLILSGGTDFHEFKKNGKEIGDRGISKKEFSKLKKYWKKRGNTFRES
jgi:predicted metal-dependent phosphoesterase TrpH